MEHANTEIAQLELVANEANDVQLQQLADLQFAFIGGGAAEVSFQ
jgi:hypothetical protein